VTVLADQDIEFFRRIGGLDITPWDDAQLQPVSYDLTLAPYVTYQDCYREWSEHGVVVREDWSWRTEQFDNPGLTHVLAPDEFALFSTIETVRLSAGIVGHVEGKSTIARNGVIIHFAGLVDPGFEGQLTLEVKNLSQVPFLMTAGMSIAQIEFSLTRRPALHPYGSEGVGHYQGQKGPTAPHE